MAGGDILNITCLSLVTASITSTTSFPDLDTSVIAAHLKLVYAPIVGALYALIGFRNTSSSSVISRYSVWATAPGSTSPFLLQTSLATAEYYDIEVGFTTVGNLCYGYASSSLTSLHCIGYVDPIVPLCSAIDFVVPDANSVSNITIAIFYTGNVTGVQLYDAITARWLVAELPSNVPPNSQIEASLSTNEASFWIIAVAPNGTVVLSAYGTRLPTLTITTAAIGVSATNFYRGLSGLALVPPCCPFTALTL
jgi:hypothetical protein